MTDPKPARGERPEQEYFQVWYPPRRGKDDGHAMDAPAPAIVPIEDHPLKGWRWVGVRLLASDLWPREAATNPVLVYFVGRRRRAQVEDYVGLIPWLISCGAVWATCLPPLGAKGYAMPTLAFLQFYSPLVTLLLSALMVSWSVRRSLDALPIQQLLLTRLRAVDIVQGLTIRPLVIQMCGVAALSASTALALLWIGILPDSAPKVSATMASGQPFWDLFMVLPPCFIASRFAAEIGGAYAIRCHLFLRTGQRAILRLCWDLAWVLLWMAVANMLCFVVRGVALQATPLILPFLVGGFLAVQVSILMWLRSCGLGAMDFTHHNWPQWWALVDREDKYEHHLERHLFTPWRVLPDARRMWHMRG